MNDKEEIKKLQEELRLLQRDLYVQQERAARLQQRLEQLGGEPLKKHLSTPKLLTGFSLENFIGLRLIHVIGIVVLVIGLSIGVKYAIDRNFISEELRILLAYVAGLVLYLLSFRLKNTYAGFSAILFSGAMASLYFTTYAAHVYYSMFPFAVAFSAMILLTVYSVYEAIRYNREEIALLGLIGAYGIPFLISRNADRADLFFIYISVINLGAVFLSIRKSWKNTGIVAQIITWLLFIGWSATRFDVEARPLGIVFMSFFFLLFFLAVASLKFFHQKSLNTNDTYRLVLNNLALYIAALFVFGLPESAAANLSMITLVMGMLVGLQAGIFYTYWKEETFSTRMLSFAALTLFILFIAFNWDGLTVTLLWLLTAVVVFAFGFYVRSVATRMAAILLIGLTLGKLLALDSSRFTTVQKVIAYLVLGVLLLVVSFFYQKFRQKIFDEGSH